MKQAVNASAQLIHIQKSYGHLSANKDVNLNIQPKTIHALIGENGAGKSTAMKILFGLETPDQGQIIINGTEVKNWHPNKAFQHGLGMVHQHFMLAETETVHDCLVLGVETTRLGIRNRKKEEQDLVKLMDESGLHVPLKEKIISLPLGLQSRCEILKVLYRKANLLILDEPTAVLAPQEIDYFLKTLIRLKNQGKTILIVTHKLKEVLAVADTITVLREGKTVAIKTAKETSIEELSELMVGRKIYLPKIKDTIKDSLPPALTTLQHQHITLPLHSGIITGIAGIEGSGQSDIIQCLLENYKNKPISVIPSDRQQEGVILNFKLFENLRLKRSLIQAKRKLEYFSPPTSDEIDLLKTYDIRPPLPNTVCKALSGGNQQKLIIARELSSKTSLNNSILLAVHPTRGVDLGAIEFIHHKIIWAAQQGMAVLLISSELEELMNLSHKIGALYQRRIAKWFYGPNYNEKEIGIAMLSGN